jgi:hypothetical protein
MQDTPQLWADIPRERSKRTTNEPEAFHSHFITNSLFFRFSQCSIDIQASHFNVSCRLKFGDYINEGKYTGVGGIKLSDLANGNDV